jgi:hypothetical protein
MKNRRLKKIVKRIVKSHEDKLTEKRIELGFYSGVSKQLWGKKDDERFNELDSRLRLWQEKKPDQRPKEFDKWIEEIRALNEKRIKCGIIDDKIDGPKQPGTFVRVGGIKGDIWLIERYLEYLKELLNS